VKIAQVMAGAANGGAELFFERCTIALARSGHEVLPLIRAEPAREARFHAAGLAVQKFRFGGPLDLFTKPGLRGALQRFGADVAIAWMSRAAAHLPTGVWITAGRLGGYYNLEYFGACKHLIGNTRGITAWIAGQGWPPERIHYLPNFVDEFAHVAPASRAELGVPEGAKLLLGLGRLHKVKGFDTLIHAAALLPNVYVLIAGEGPERPALERLIAERGLGARVRLLGWRHDTGALLKAADLFVSSSRHEPLGNMVLEAFSAARPVLAARAEGPSEIIRDGVDGVLVPIDDPVALAEAARAILADPAGQAALGMAGRARFETEFSQATVVAAWSDFLTKVTR
jgi:glycosyltransferase involved in cell wall biosynthesis